MEEPSRIGMTASAMSKLEELIDELNPAEGEEGTRLIKFDLYRIAVAHGIKNRLKPEALNGKSVSSFRVSELDEDGILYLAVSESNLVGEGESIYEFIERLAEHGVNEFYSSFRATGQLPFDEIFSK
jgi:hypothetical protein